MSPPKLGVPLNYWLASHVFNTRVDASCIIPKQVAEDESVSIRGLLCWDPCPVLTSIGQRAFWQGKEMWLVLAVPETMTGMERHENTRLRLLLKDDSTWLDAGNILPDGYCPGSREWAAVAYLQEDSSLSLYFTAAGLRGESRASAVQRLFFTQAKMGLSERSLIPIIGAWEEPQEILMADGASYLPADEIDFTPGNIRAFRDPCLFSDPQTGETYLLFAGSDARTHSAEDALIGIAKWQGTSKQWQLESPLLSGAGVTKEMERPHMIAYGGRYYLFWSTNSWTFAENISAPSGLYGMVAETLGGPYQPINGTGLVASNPLDQPFLTYSWWVSNDLKVTSFVDLPDGSRDPAAGKKAGPRGRFAGRIAGDFQLHLVAARSWISSV